MSDIETFANFIQELADREPEVFKDLVGATSDRVVKIADARGVSVSRETVHEFARMTVDLLERHDQSQYEMSDDALQHVSGGVLSLIDSAAGAIINTALHTANTALNIVSASAPVTGPLINEFGPAIKEAKTLIVNWAT
ncbi:hypothetical protein Thiowin_01806 [Thiorhodovibrio winogradskyi]|uniref:Nif11 domain-containing protein n=1 Tax=Thiorhodovibrio winogradskyi TaxID=77007 RepID=A0ABZ0S7D4_9GAMM|nr:hypothetical protein [Thiorhodovibrio winogradskyi]